MTIYYLSLEEYKKYFYAETEIKEDQCDLVIVRVEPIGNHSDRKWEYSIYWENVENDEKGNIYGINTSSYWSLASCSWSYLEEED